MRVLLTAVVLSCLSLAGCSTIYRTVSLDAKPASSVNIDAKARMILVTDFGGREANRRVICAEPSPDTAVGIATSALAAANVANRVDAQVAATLAEAVQSVGRRTQSIQLLRDGLYRACEAYLNGAISSDEYRLLLSRISAFAITLVAIDGLTGGQSVPATSINTKGSAKTGAGGSTQPGLEAGAEAGAAGGQAGASVPTLAQDNVNAVTAIVQGFYDLQRHIFDQELQKSGQAMTSGITEKADEPAKKP
jgi:hypothetical protein